jgi:hypothetical protein
MGEHTRALSGQWLSKHVPIARQQILNNATVGLQQWRSSVFCMVHVERLKGRQGLELSQLSFNSVRESVKRGLELLPGNV